MKIIKYNSSNDMEIQFDNGYIKKCYYYDFIKGRIYNPLDKTNYNIGYLGIGEYVSKDKPYSTWRRMLQRCYDETFLVKYTTYKGCAVCDEWHNYQNFAKWYDENYYTVQNEKMELDKDILIKGNKIYSPETCVFVPEYINYLFVKRNKLRGEYPIGVTLHSDKDKLIAQCHDINKKSIYIGKYYTIEEAFEAYKNYKEKLIKDIADMYYGLIPQKLHEAMYKYKVEITD
jgi:hypothetical protein